MNVKNPIIVLTGGGSGGHITPLLSLARELKRKNPKCHIVYIGQRGENLEDLSERFKIFDTSYFIPAGKYRRYYGQSLLARLTDLKTFLLNVRDFFKVIFGIFTARRILKRTRPQIVFSKGGFVAVPVGIAARLAHIPIITHDSDTVAGLANRIVGRWAVARAAGMPIDGPVQPGVQTVFTGIPIDERIKPLSPAVQKDFKKQIGVPEGSRVLLIGGAGLGSLTINNTVIAMAPKLLDAHHDLYFIHLAGRKHARQVEQAYGANLTADQRKRVTVEGFTADFYRYTGAADLVISRAGATTIAELAVQAKPLILIPAPFLSEGHQIKNAQSLEKAGAAVVVSDGISPDKLLDTVNELLGNSAELKALSEKISTFAKPDAAAKLADLIFDTAAYAGGASQNASP